LYLDARAWQQKRELQNRELDFALAATSHMAEAAFDHHASFCQEYMDTVYDAMKTHFEKGPNPEALATVYKLAELRRKYAVWLSDGVEAGLIKFEHALAEGGALAELMNHSSSVGGMNATTHRTVVEKAFRAFRTVFTPEAEGKGAPEDADASYMAVRTLLRELLGIPTLGRLRQTVMEAADRRAAD
jgi:hypothetical protein